jgi:hypothetical protein
VDLRRPWGAIDLLVTMLHALGGAVDPDVDLVESALMNAATGPSDDSARGPSLLWEVGELLDYLERSASDIETRARLEFLYAPLLQHTRAARALNEVLGADPALFAEILSYTFYAEGEPHDEDVPPERQAIALVGYTVIREWHTPPGVRPDGTVDADALRGWVTEARRLLAESGRTTIGDVVIGKVLAYFPSEADGLWPAEPVRDLAADLYPDVLDVDQGPDSADLGVLRAWIGEWLASVWPVQVGSRATLRRLPLACHGSPLARSQGRAKPYPALDER